MRKIQKNSKKFKKNSKKFRKIQKNSKIRGNTKAGDEDFDLRFSLESFTGLLRSCRESTGSFPSFFSFIFIFHLLLLLLLLLLLSIFPFFVFHLISFLVSPFHLFSFLFVFLPPPLHSFYSVLFAITKIQKNHKRSLTS